MKRIAVIVGHSKVEQGAYAPAPLDISEWALMDQVADEMLALGRGRYVMEKFHRVYQGRGRYGSEMRELFSRVNPWKPDITIELHFNDFGDSSIHGYEVVSSGSPESRRLAQCFLEQGKVFPRTNRGIKVRGSRDRGGLSVHLGRAPAVLLEPFACSYPGSLQGMKQLGVKGLATIYMKAIDTYFGEDAASQAAPHEPVTGDLRFGLGKNAWCQENAGLLAAMVKQAGNLSLTEFFAVAYAELGLDAQGHVAPHHVHSNGERGPLPLPSNLEYWIGYPKPDTVSPTLNVRLFIEYLSGIKKSSVYGELFQDQDAVSSARILCACVHGWFYQGAYTLTLPRHAIAHAVAHSDGDEPGAATQLLGELGYKHGEKLIKGRLANADYGIGLARELELA